MSYLKKITLFFIFLLTTFLYSDPILSIKISSDKLSQSSGKVLVTLKNNSQQSIKILKWNTPLEEKINSDIFKIYKNNKEIPYIGRHIKRVQPTQKDFLVFEAGEEYQSWIDLPLYYKMRSEGNYTISYSSPFTILTESKKHKLSKEKFSQENRLTISFVSSLQKEISRKINADFEGCSENRIDILNNSQTEAIKIAKKASDAMNSASQDTTAPRYTTWFGEASSSRQALVTSHFDKIYNALDTKKLKFDCSTCNEDGVFGYVYTNQPYQVYLCGAFWSANINGTDSQAGTLIHELSHFIIIAGTDDHVYGQDDAKSLAQTKPDSAVDNADNHEYFAEDTPHLTMDSSNTNTIIGATPNNSFQNAIELLSFPYSDTIESTGDKNIYKFKPTEDGQYTFYTTQNLDTIGKLYDKNQKLLIENDDISRNNENFQFTYELKKSEFYYITVEAYQGETGEYILYKNFKSIEGGQPAEQEQNTPQREEESSSTTQEIPSLSSIGLLILFVLSSFIFSREIKKIL